MLIPITNAIVTAGSKRMITQRVRFERCGSSADIRSGRVATIRSLRHAPIWGLPLEFEYMRAIGDAFDNAGIPCSCPLVSAASIAGVESSFHDPQRLKFPLTVSAAVQMRIQRHSHRWERLPDGGLPIATSSI